METDKTGNIIIFKVFNDFADAGFTQVKLREAGIEAFLEDENVAGLNPLGGVELKIFAKDLEAASAIMAAQ